MEVNVVTEDSVFDLLPDTVKILHTTYELDTSPNAKEILDHKDRLGEVSFANEKIRVNIQSGPNTADTIIHEIIHVLVHMFDLELEEREEHIVLTLSTGLVTVMKDNPDLFPALQLLVDDAE